MQYSTHCVRSSGGQYHTGESQKDVVNLGWLIAPKWAQMREMGGGGGGIAGSQPMSTEAESKEKTWCVDPSQSWVVDYNLTLCPFQSRLQHNYHGQPYAKVDFIPRSGTLDFASAVQMEPK